MSFKEGFSEKGRGRQPGGFSLGPSGKCICSKCKKEVDHEKGIPCYEKKCPSCGSKMTRKRE